MSDTRDPLVLLAVGLFLSATVVSTGGFSSMTSDRSVHVTVAGDGDAYLGFESSPTNTTNGTTDLEVTVANQFTGGTELSTVQVTVDGKTIDLVPNGPLPAGESETHTVQSVSCDGLVSVAATGPNVAVRLTRSVACGA
jgi:hypothetical protein